MWWHHLFDTHGFPVAARYGRSWEPALIITFVAARGMAAAAYLIFIGAFAQFHIRWKQGRINRFLGQVHAPRVAVIYLVSVCFDFVLQVALIAGFWWPAFRFIGLLTFLSAVSLFAAALKTLWALTLCTMPAPEPEGGAL